MKKALYILGFLLVVVVIDLDAQVIMVEPDSLTSAASKVRVNKKNKDNPTNSNLRQVGIKKQKKVGGTPIIIYDPTDSSKKNLILKTIPKQSTK